MQSPQKRRRRRRVNRGLDFALWYYIIIIIIFLSTVSLFTECSTKLLCAVRARVCVCVTLVIVNRAQFNLTNMANPPGGRIVQLNTEFLFFFFLTHYFIDKRHYSISIFFPSLCNFL